jgi:hypothetical protein
LPRVTRTSIKETKLAIPTSAAFVAFNLGTAAYADTAAFQLPKQISDEENKIPQAQPPANFKQKPAEPPPPGK